MLSPEKKSRSGLRPLIAAVTALTLAAGLTATHADDALPKIPNKKPLKVGFAQAESNNP